MSFGDMILIPLGDHCAAGPGAPGKCVTSPGISAAGSAR
jgi:hypothetical protein